MGSGKQRSIIQPRVTQVGSIREAGRLAKFSGALLTIKKGMAAAKKIHRNLPPETARYHNIAFQLGELARAVRQFQADLLPKAVRERLQGGYGWAYHGGYIWLLPQFDGFEEIHRIHIGKRLWHYFYKEKVARWEWNKSHESIIHYIQRTHGPQSIIHKGKPIPKEVSAETKQTEENANENC